MRSRDAQSNTGNDLNKDLGEHNFVVDQNIQLRKRIGSTCGYIMINKDELSKDVCPCLHL